MNIIQHYPITPYESPIPLKYGHSRKLNRKRIVQAFYNYAGLLLEDYFCTLLFGSILFDPLKPADKVWEDVDESLKKLREILFKQANVADVWVTVEIHRSHSHRKNNLAGRPHLHFIVSYACHEHLGPTPFRLLSTLRENFYDVEVRRVKKTQKNYSNIFRYLWKDACYSDTVELLKYYKQKSAPYNLWVGSVDLLDDAKKLFFTLLDQYGEMVTIRNCLNQYCFHTSPKASDELIVTKVVWHTLRVGGFLCIGDTVYKKRSKNHQYAYEPVDQWSTFIWKHLDTVKRWYYPLEAAIHKVVNSNYSFVNNFPKLTLHHRYIEGTDGVYDTEKDKFQLTENFQIPKQKTGQEEIWFREDPQFRLRQAFDVPLADICENENEAARLSKIYDDWLSENEINPILFKTIMGSLLHKRVFARDVKVPVLSGKPGAGKSLVCRLYADLVGKEFVGELATDGRFAFQSVLNKVLTLIDDAEWKQSPQQLKLLLEGTTFSTEKKYGGMVKIEPTRTVVTSQSGDFTYIFDNTLNATAFESRCHKFNFIKKLNHEKAQELMDAFPAFAIVANRAYLALKQNEFSEAFLDELMNN